MKICAILFLVFVSIKIHAQTSPVPNTPLLTLDGKRVNLNDFIKKGQINILTYIMSATPEDDYGCPPCRKQLNYIMNYLKRTGQDRTINFIAVSKSDFSRSSIVKHDKQVQGWNFTILLDDKDELYNSLDVRGTPYTFIINRDKKIVDSHVGLFQEEELFKKAK